MPEPLGIFGGTFDPVHFGHLRLAEEAIGHLGLAGVRWIPAGRPPHREPPRAGPQERLEMVLRSTAGNPRFSVDAGEVAAKVPSYTVHTLERLRAESGSERPLVLLVGADAFAGLETWHCWRDIFALAHLGVAYRPGFPIDGEALPPALAAEFSARRQRDPLLPVHSEHPVRDAVEHHAAGGGAVTARTGRIEQRRRTDTRLRLRWHADFALREGLGASLNWTLGSRVVFHGLNFFCAFAGTKGALPELPRVTFTAAPGSPGTGMHKGKEPMARW